MFVCVYIYIYIFNFKRNMSVKMRIPKAVHKTTKSDSFNIRYGHWLRRLVLDSDFELQLVNTNFTTMQSRTHDQARHQYSNELTSIEHHRPWCRSPMSYWFNSRAFIGWVGLAQTVGCRCNQRSVRRTWGWCGRMYSITCKCKPGNTYAECNPRDYLRLWVKISDVIKKFEQLANDNILDQHNISNQLMLADDLHNEAT